MSDTFLICNYIFEDNKQSIDYYIAFPTNEREYWLKFIKMSRDEQLREIKAKDVLWDLPQKSTDIRLLEIPIYLNDSIDIIKKKTKGLYRILRGYIHR